ncbi:MAG TPA: hypothetical protein PKE37_16350 [Thiomonas arsenitoxydans]|uniref:hypothetical protein n=1 Tax=Thiomonas arsenitoxydans (strain DSM 22701 / CIP 110005 / 3As) TaxID=426114 RepID=UPI002B54BF75|nr:hypothetical protein [Thiomonas arsenitoxydans]HML83326.1 hypothetical protein [Thiomonas arsenitoxydans]
MTAQQNTAPPSCRACGHVERIVVWAKGRPDPIKQRYDRCIHLSGPHPMHTPCGWFAAKTQGAMA